MFNSINNVSRMQTVADSKEERGCYLGSGTFSMMLDPVEASQELRYTNFLSPDAGKKDV